MLDYDNMQYSKIPPEIRLKNTKIPSDEHVNMQKYIILRKSI